MQLAKEIADLAERARSKKLSPDEVQGGTFTITNHGGFGSLFSAPIIHQPQIAILGVGAIQKRAVVINEGIAIRPMGYLSLSFDHRVIDGATADRFMAKVKDYLEHSHWEQIL
jgi:pyruvate/2-oxoglutarate dehydrogenase complex dihydrolipoamide acyltransferase (E2) component